MLKPLPDSNKRVNGTSVPFNTVLSISNINEPEDSCKPPAFIEFQFTLKLVTLISEFSVVNVPIILSLDIEPILDKVTFIP